MLSCLVKVGCFLVAIGVLRGQDSLESGLLPGSNYEDRSDDSRFNFDFNFGGQLPESLKVSHEGLIRYELNGERVVYERDPEGRRFSLETNEGTELFAETAEAYLNSNEIVLAGRVTIFQGPILVHCERAIYNWTTETIKTSNVKGGMPPFLIEADEFEVLETEGRQFLQGTGAAVTTHDLANPNFWFRAKQVKIFPEERMVFKGMNLQAGERNIFWLPYLSRSFDADLGFNVTPGARSDWGPFLLTRYGMPWLGERDEATGVLKDPRYTVQWLLDARALRGVGLGVELYDNKRTVNLEPANLSLYFTNDWNANRARSGISRGDVNANRYRVDIAQQFDLEFTKEVDRRGDWAINLNTTLLSDRFVLEDFFTREFRIDPDPDNIVSLVRFGEGSVTEVLTRFRPNDFYASDTRLPELTFDQIRRPIFGTPVLHEGQTSIGRLEEKLPDFRIRELQDEMARLNPGDPRINQIQARLSPHGFTRFHTYHELSGAVRPVPWLSLVPRVGAGFTTYQSVLGDVGSDTRSILTAALDSSVKFSKSYPEIRNRKLGVDGLVHVVQPYASISYLSTNELDRSFPSIDRMVTTTRLRPIHVGRFSAVDEIRDWQILRTGVRNSFITKRDGAPFTWLTWDVYFDSFLEDPEFDRAVSNLFTEVQWSPVPWARFGLEAQLPVFDEESDFIELNSAVVFMPNENTELGLFHSYLNSHPILQDSNLLGVSLFHRINEDWGIQIFHRWEFEDRVLEDQRYTINRNLGSWNMSFGGFRRDNRVRSEYGVLLGFSLNAFPQVNLPLMVDAN